MQKSLHKQYAGSLDVAAISASSLCAIHCLLLPMIGTILPIAGVISEIEWIHKALVIIAIPISGFVIMSSRSRLRDLPMIALAIVGIGFLILAAFVEGLHSYEQPLTTFGAFILAATHFNWWRHHQKISEKLSPDSEIK